MNWVIQTTWIVWLLSILICLGCQAGSQVKAPPKSVIDCSRTEQLQGKPVVSKINPSNQSLWKVDETWSSGKEDLFVIRFLNAQEGWVGGARAGLYKTVDQGKTWQRIKIQAHPKSHVASLFFIDPQIGWVAVNKAARDMLKPEENEMWLWQTGDGGHNWVMQYL